MKRDAFLISKTNTDHDYREIPLDNGWSFYYRGNIKVSYFKGTISSIILVGNAWQCIPGKKSPEDIIEELASNNNYSMHTIVKEKYSWGGRFAIIAFGKIYTDAFGMMPIYYSDTCISNKFSEMSKRTDENSYLYKGGRMDWCPAPMTPCVKVKRLLPSQIFDYETGHMHYYDLIPDDDFLQEYGIEIDKHTIPEIYTEFSSCFLKNMYRDMKHKQIVVPITGGYDSRLVLAECVKAKIPVKCITIIRENMKPGDISIPYEVCDEAGVDYYPIDIRDEEPDEKRLKEYQILTHGMSMGTDMKYYAAGAYNQVEDMFGDVLLLRGGISEVTTIPYKKFLNNDLKAIDIIRLYNLKDFEAEAIREYMAWCYESPQDNLFLPDRFYWEQRCASWLAEIEDGFSLYDNISSIQVFNCSLLMWIQLQSPHTKRVSKENKKELIKKACPEIAKIPFAGATITDKIWDLKQNTWLHVKRLLKGVTK